MTKGPRRTGSRELDGVGRPIHVLILYPEGNWLPPPTLCAFHINLCVSAVLSTNASLERVRAIGYVGDFGIPEWPRLAARLYRKGTCLQAKVEEMVCPDGGRLRPGQQHAPANAATLARSRSPQRSRF